MRLVPADDSSLVSDAGRPSAAHGAPFIRTRNCRPEYGDRLNNTFKLLSRRSSFTEILKSAFLTSW